MFSIADPTEAWRYNYNFAWRYGVRGGVADPKVVYELPYSPEEKHKLIQGYLGSFSHYKGSPNEYAYDFVMPVGTTVRAARDGVVTGVRQDSDVRGTTPAFMTSGNYIIVRHSNGTYAEYMHLKKDGAMVAPRDTVTTGQATACRVTPVLHRGLTCISQCLYPSTERPGKRCPLS